MLRDITSVIKEMKKPFQKASGADKLKMLYKELIRKNDKQSPER